MSATTIPYCVTVFRIVPARGPNGQAGYVAKWVHKPRIAEGAFGKQDASPWKPTRDLVLAAMGNLYADVQEYGKEYGNG